MHNMQTGRDGRWIGRRYDMDFCSSCGKKKHNQDYVLTNPQVGACVADGISGAPLGDAVARYVCHEAMRSLEEGCNAAEALDVARERAKRFLQMMDLPRSGASVMVLKYAGDKIEVAWLGDVALFALEEKEGELSLASSLDLESEYGTPPVSMRSKESPNTTLLSAGNLRRLAVCTDGVWREQGCKAIEDILRRDASAREAATRLVLRENAVDDATAMVVAPDESV